MSILGYFTVNNSFAYTEDNTEIEQDMSTPIRSPSIGTPKSSTDGCFELNN